MRKILVQIYHKHYLGFIFDLRYFLSTMESNYNLLNVSRYVKPYDIRRMWDSYLETVTLQYSGSGKPSAYTMQIFRSGHTFSNIRISKMSEEKPRSVAVDDFIAVSNICKFAYKLRTRAPQSGTVSAIDVALIRCIQQLRKSSLQS